MDQNDHSIDGLKSHQANVHLNQILYNWYGTLSLLQAHNWFHETGVTRHHYKPANVKTAYIQATNRHYYQ